MTMLMHTRGIPYSSGRQDAIEPAAANARWAAIRTFCLCAVAALAAGAAMGGIIALTTVAAFWRLHY